MCSAFYNNTIFNGAERKIDLILYAVNLENKYFRYLFKLRASHARALRVRISELYRKAHKNMLCHSEKLTVM